MCDKIAPNAWRIPALLRLSTFCSWIFPPREKSLTKKIRKNVFFKPIVGSANYASISMGRDSLRKIPPLGFFLVEIREAEPCRGGAHRLWWLRQVESYLRDMGMAGLASAWAIARRRPKEYRHKLDAAARCSGVCPHTWPDLYHQRSGVSVADAPDDLRWLSLRREMRFVTNVIIRYLFTTSRLSETQCALWSRRARVSTYPGRTLSRTYTDRGFFVFFQNQR